MKHFFTPLFILLFVSSASAQSDTRRNNNSFFEKGNKVYGIEIGIAGEYPINSVTKLNIGNNEKNYGLLMLPSYGWFVEKNWVIGGQAILGFSNNSYSYDNGTQFSVENKSRYSDFGVAPFTRYFIPLGKRNVVSIFGQASMPVVYSTSKIENKQTGNSPYNYSYNEKEVRLIGTIGLGVSLNGRFGSLEVNANTTGLYVGFHKYIGKK